MKTVLAAIDFSTGDPAVLDQAVSFARALEARLVILHALEIPEFNGDPANLPDQYRQLVAATEQSVASRLTRLEDQLRNEYPAIEFAVITGDPVPTILANATSLDAELIVLGSHSHGAIYELLVGSTTRGILKAATCPVMVVPATCGQAADLRVRPQSVHA